MALIIINQLIYPYASQWGIFLLSFGGTCVYYLWENLSTWSLIVTSLFRATSLAVKWETLCSFPFSHLHTFSFPSLSSNFLVHKHADDDWWCLLGYLDEGFVCVLDTVLVAYMSQCVSGTWSDLTWKKQIRGCVYNPIAIFPAWNVLSGLLVTYSLKYLRWENGVYAQDQALSVNPWRLDLALVPVDTFTLSLGSRGSVVYEEGSVDRGWIPWPPWAFSFHLRWSCYYPFLLHPTIPVRHTWDYTRTLQKSVTLQRYIIIYKALSVFCCMSLTSDLPIFHNCNYFKSCLSLMFIYSPISFLVPQLTNKLNIDREY